MTRRPHGAADPSRLRSSAGPLVLRAADRLVVRGAKRLAALAGGVLDCKAEVLMALQAETAPVLTAQTNICTLGTPTKDAEADSVVPAETDPGVAMALDVFRGSRIMAARQPALWPQADTWVPTSARTIDVYAAEMPTAACPCCGPTAWFRAGEGWACSTCHPPPTASRRTWPASGQEEGDRDTFVSKR
jgi:hypothetical protein